MRVNLISARFHVETFLVWNGATYFSLGILHVGNFQYLPCKCQDVSKQANQVCETSFVKCFPKWMIRCTSKGDKPHRRRTCARQANTQKTTTACCYILCTDSCPAGTRKDIGSLTCAPCPAGFHQNEPDKLFCLPCPAGHYQSFRGSTFCYQCEYGYYQNDTGMQFCHKCPADQTTFVKDAQSIHQCSGW